jgi:hypothetical protein
MEAVSFDPIWEDKYKAGHQQRAPWDEVVSFLFRNMLVQRCQGPNCTNFGTIAAGVTSTTYSDTAVVKNTVLRTCPYETRAAGSPLPSPPPPHKDGFFFLPKTYLIAFPPRRRNAGSGCGTALPGLAGKIGSKPEADLVCGADEPYTSLGFP